MREKGRGATAPEIVEALDDFVRTPYGVKSKLKREVVRKRLKKIQKFE